MKRFGESGTRAPGDRCQIRVNAPESRAHIATETAREQAQRIEDGLRDDVQRGLAKRLRRSGIRELPRWMRGGLLFTSLLQIETAAAGDRLEAPEEWRPRMTEGARRELEPYMAEDGSASMTVIYVDNAVRLIKKNDVDSDEALVFENQVDTLIMRQELPASAMPTAHEGEMFWHWGHDEGHTMAVGQWIDGFGNQITVFRSKEGGDETCAQSVFVEPAFAFAQPGEDPKLQRLAIDLTPVGGTHIFTAFWQRELPAVELIGKNRVFASGAAAEDVRQLLGEYGDDLSRGSESVDALFGYRQPASIVIVEDGTPNAHYTGWGTISINTGLFSYGDEGKRGVLLEETIEHEQMHYRDDQYDISASPMVLRTFASAMPGVLRELNESAFAATGFGGHAQDNEKEFVATILNTIDSPNWEQAAILLSPEAKRVYREGLTAARDQITTKSLAYRLDSPPIVDLLSTRIAALEAMSTAE